MGSSGSNPNPEVLELLAVGCWDQTLSFYQATGVQHLKDRKLHFYPCSLSYFSDGEYIVIGGEWTNNPHPHFHPEPRTGTYAVRIVRIVRHALLHVSSPLPHHPNNPRLGPARNALHERGGAAVRDLRQEGLGVVSLCTALPSPRRRQRRYWQGQGLAHGCGRLLRWKHQRVHPQLQPGPRPPPGQSGDYRGPNLTARCIATLPPTASTQLSNVTHPAIKKKTLGPLRIPFEYDGRGGLAPSNGP